MSNPLLEPIHGITLQDYATIAAKAVAGIDIADICKTLGIEEAIYEEASALWISRMRQDSTFQIMTLYGQYFADPDSHPKLGNLKVEVSEEGNSNIEKMTTDRYFYEELNGARQAAYEYGYDGAQWILDNYGINLSDFQSVAMQWMTDPSHNDNEATLHFLDYRTQKQKEYAQKFAEEQGGNIADDVEF